MIARVGDRPGGKGERGVEFGAIDVEGHLAGVWVEVQLALEGGVGILGEGGAVLLGLGALALLGDADLALTAEIEADAPFVALLIP